MTQGEFNWSKTFQGYLLSSYFYGYMATQILGGWLTGKYGAKHVIGGGILLSVAATFVTPAAARWNRWLVMGARIVSGFGSVRVWQEHWSS